MFVVVVVVVVLPSFPLLFNFCQFLSTFVNFCQLLSTFVNFRHLWSTFVNICQLIEHTKLFFLFQNAIWNGENILSKQPHLVANSSTFETYLLKNVTHKTILFYSKYNLNCHQPTLLYKYCHLVAKLLFS